MIRVGWLVDDAGTVGGAELTQAEFRAAAPAGVEIVDCPAGEVVQGLDQYVIHNAVTYTVTDLAVIGDRPAVKYWHDVGPWVKADVKEWIAGHATEIYCSPVQMRFMGADDGLCVPPPVDLARFRKAAEASTERAGAVSVAAWGNPGKAPHRAAEWAVENGSIDFYGGGACAPNGSQEVEYDAMPALLASYETFVHLPTVIEPFGRLVVEAWAAGCELVVNSLVGARWWIENDPDALETAAADFWDLIAGVVV